MADANKRPPGAMTDKELAAEAASLAKARTEIRERQVAVQAEVDTRVALAGMPSEARRIVQLRLEGGLAPKGGRS